MDLESTSKGLNPINNKESVTLYMKQRVHKKTQELNDYEQEHG